KLISYGKTYEGRELLAVVLSAAGNMNRLEEIRESNLALSKGQQAKLKDQPAVLWMSYNVHGNEASSSETAMKTLFTLSQNQTNAIKQYLQNTVVILDPCLNPDGRERYVQYFNAVSGIKPDASPDAREHREPWPYGRVNHYYFDLNRDWAWQTQVETQQRLALYRQWMPEVHVDFHEQNYNIPYYFAPAAEPVHQDITAWQKAFQVTVGKNNAKYFDEKGWKYFTKERFDLLYPSYGDTYPLYNGAIGMTYEQGGIGAGLAVVTKDGDTLRLKDRIDHHFSNAMSTLEVVSGNADKLVSEFKNYFLNSKKTIPGPYQTYVVKADGTGKIGKLAELLNKNGISYAYGADKTLSGFDFESKNQVAYKIQRNDLIVNLHQPAAVLANVLFEPQTSIRDSDTYDITAWAIPYAYGLQTYATKQSIYGKNPDQEQKATTGTDAKHPYAWILGGNSMEDVKNLIKLQNVGLSVRIAGQSFQADGQSYPQGSLLLYRIDNERNAKNLDVLMDSLQHKLNIHLQTVSSGFVEKGKDLGSPDYELLKKRQIAVVSGPDTYAASVGEIWHFFEQELDYPVKMIGMEELNNLDINKTNVLILPNGKYPLDLNEKLDSWVKLGGKVILMEGAVEAVAGKKPFEINKKVYVKVDKKALPYSSKFNPDFSESIPGAIYKVSLDASHPLSFGLGKYFYTIKADTVLYEPLKEGSYNVGILKTGSYMSGIAAKSVQKRLDSGLIFGVQPYGKGTILYFATDILFRSFWENGKKLFLNAVFLMD
ncbi:MAG: hypothetical protein JWQ28_953, partial [Pedobacter sp.]|nr:hypothetical protein [Pedobacter sp.]